MQGSGVKLDNDHWLYQLPESVEINHEDKLTHIMEQTWKFHDVLLKCVVEH
jgi:hypothetical protein